MSVPGAGTIPGPVTSPLVRLLAPRPFRRATAVRLAIVAALSLLTAIGLAEHPLWLDEALAWNIARTSDSLGELTPLLHYGGHPIGWYLPLYAITRVTGDPAWLQVLQWAIATATFAVVLLRTPFRLPVQVLVALGYFFLFEFAVISRPYGLCALLFFLAVDALARERPRRVLGSALLVVLVFVHQLGAVLAIALVVVEVWRWWSVRGGDGRRRVPRDALLSAGVVLLAVAGMLATVAPSSNAGRNGFFGGGRLADAPLDRVQLAVGSILDGLLPIPERIVWDQLVWRTVPLWVTVVLGLVLFAIVLLALRHDRVAALLWAVGSFGLVAFFSLAYPPRHVRFTGFFMLLLVACCWYAVRLADAARSPEPSAPPRRADPLDRVALGALALVVLVQVVVASVLVVHFLGTPFLQSREQADAIRAAGLQGRVISANDYAAIPIAAYLDHDYESLAFDRPTRTIVFRNRAARKVGLAILDSQGAFRVAAARAACDDRPVALVMGVFVPAPPDGARLIGPDVYEVQPGSAPEGCPRP